MAMSDVHTGTMGQTAETGGYIVWFLHLGAPSFTVIAEVKGRF